MIIELPPHVRAAIARIRDSARWWYQGETLDQEQRCVIAKATRSSYFAWLNAIGVRLYCKHNPCTSDPSRHFRAGDQIQAKPYCPIHS